MRRLGGKAGVKYAEFREFAETRPGEVVANIALCLINQATYLLDQQIRRLEEDFLKEGGLRERMTKARLESRARQRRAERKIGPIGLMGPMGPMIGSRKRVSAGSKPR